MLKKERIIIVLLAAINFTHILDFMIMMPLGNYLMPFFDISPREFSILVGSYPVSAFFSGIFIAFFADKFERKKLLLFTYVGFLIGTLACGFVSSYNLLLVSRIFAGIFGGIIGGQILSIAADVFPYERRGMAMGAIMSAFAIASSVGVTFSLYLTNIFKSDWHVPFLFVGILAILIIPLTIFYLPSQRGHLSHSEKNNGRFHVLFQVIENRDQRLALLFSTLIMMGHFLIIPFINPYMEFNKGYSQDQTPMIYLFGGIASFFSAILLGRFSDRIGKLKVFSWSVLFSFVMVWIITNMPLIPFSLVLILFAIWFALATGRAVTAQAMISNVVKAGQRGSFMSFNSSVQQLGTAIASFVAGYVVTKDNSGKLLRYEWVGYLSILVLLLGLLLGRYLFAGMDKKEVINPLPSTPDISGEPVADLVSSDK